MQLKYVVFAPKLFEDLFAEAKQLLMQQDYRIQWSDEDHRSFAIGVLPGYTKRNLPSTIFSERDIEQYLLSVICRPVLSICKAVNKKDFGKHAVDMGYPFISSSVQDTKANAVVPDFILVKEGKYPEHVITAVIEAKSENVIRISSAGDSNSSRPAAQRANVLTELQSVEVPLGYAMSFKWPETTKDGDNDECTRILVQVGVN